MKYTTLWAIFVVALVTACNREKYDYKENTKKDVWQGTHTPYASPYSICTTRHTMCLDSMEQCLASQEERKVLFGKCVTDRLNELEKTQ